MTDRQRKYLSDIAYAIELIDTFQNGIVSYEAYRIDFKTKSAIERQIAIIGEALAKLAKEADSPNITNGKQIINLRNRLVHAYDQIDDSIIWAILKNHIRPLYLEISQFL